MSLRKDVKTAKRTAHDTKRDELLSAPHRESWQKPTTYHEIFIVPSRKKHDSGWHVMVIVGVKPDGTFEQAAWCDDICWDVQGRAGYMMRTDCTFPSGILHFWGARYEVGMSLSSTDITVREQTLR
jgi:hypothetical protein